MTATPHPSLIHRRPDKPLFPLGTLLATPGAIALLKALAQSPFELVSRHWQGDWGDLDDADVQANVAALHYGTRLLSSYTLGECQQTLWIITEADRSATTLLLPEEY